MKRKEPPRRTEPYAVDTLLQRHLAGVFDPPDGYLRYATLARRNGDASDVYFKWKPTESEINRNRRAAATAWSTAPWCPAVLGSLACTNRHTCSLNEPVQSIEVKCLATSAANALTPDEPFFALLEYEEDGHEQVLCGTNSESMELSTPQIEPTVTRMQGGRTCVDFLQDYASFLSIDALVDRPGFEETFNTVTEEDLSMLLAVFRHEEFDHIPSRLVEQFEKRNDKRLRMALALHDREEGGMDAVVERYRNALQRARTKTWASKGLWEEVETIHSHLASTSVPAKYRDQPVKVGNIHFDARNMETKMLALERQLEGLHELWSAQPDQPPTNRVVRIVLHATMFFFGILDIHPFRDGNGRLARILLQSALEKAGWPKHLVVHLFESKQNRKKYADILNLTRRNLSLVFHRSDGERVSMRHRLEAYRCTGLFGPLVKLILMRMAECAYGWHMAENDMLLKKPAENRSEIIREWREEAAEDACLICHDDGGLHMATLCCGQAMHISCLNQWLLSNNSCPYCRVTLPSVQESILSVSLADDHIGPVMGLPLALFRRVQQQLAMPDEDGENDVTDDEESAIEVSSREDVNDTTNDESSSDDDMNDTTSVQHHNQMRHNDTTSDDESENDTTMGIPDGCNGVRCRNRMANDCPNDMCGRCCRNYGTSNCFRHAG